jgi:uncharacterized membrane protein
MDNEKNKALAAIGYIPFLCFIPIYTARDDDFAQFHGKQSLVLLITYIIISIALWLVAIILGGVLGHIPLIGFVFKVVGWIAHNFIGTILGIIYFIVIIIGIILAATGKQWEIPIISTYAKNLRI